MSQPSAVASASLARSSPRCQLWTSLPRFPSGFSRLWSGPATKPSSEIDMWQVVSGIGVPQDGCDLEVKIFLQVAEHGRHGGVLRRLVVLEEALAGRLAELSLRDHPAQQRGGAVALLS